MSEYELLDLMTSMEAHMATQFSLYLSVVSAYLVVAYLVGMNLSRAQMVIASALMIFAAGGQTWALHASLGRVQEYLLLKSELSPLTEYERNFATHSYIWIGILAAGILASLYFMWSVRHPNED
ncbi:hypothetical protein EY643_07735 [Halioglobus maricola]|uniref:Uncharacterized protein n=1 Tax=Halioglobus maricola TaxID=2601894 RepID=A0A5P9NI99_9GAMM|nr:hypothetical protein [Halioglobus maricola]QFU75550.1 hypothetical protein EY643_07735 [Halioglobus maricola]